MRLNKTLWINDKKFDIVSEDIVLDENTPGKAKIVIISDSKPSGIVTFYMGYAGLKTYQYFIGYIEKATQQSAGSWHLSCAELSNALQAQCHISLIHCTLEDVLNEISETTNLNFIIPEKDYATKKVPRFYNTGTGFDACKNIGKIFEINDYIWQQQGDGKIYVGSWKDSYWANKPLTISEQFYSSAQEKSVTLATFPVIRPGCVLNNQRITKTRHKQNQMTINLSHLPASEG